MSLKVKLRSLVRLQRHPAPAQTEPLDCAYNNGKTNAARHSAAWRERLKEDPIKWKEFKAREVARFQEFRCNLTDEQKIKRREQARIRQQRFADKRKLNEQNEKQLAKKKPQRIITRNEREKKREYDRQKKRQSRARMNPQQKRRAREKEAARRREKRAEKKKRKQGKQKGGKGKNSAAAGKQGKQNRGERKSIATAAARGTPGGDHAEQGGYKTDSAKRMAISRMWTAIPDNAEKFADIVSDFINGTRATPRKKAALHARGIGAACRKELDFHHHLKTKIRTSVHALKQKKDTVSLKTRRLIVGSLLIHKKYQLSRELNLRPGYVGKLAGEIQAHGSVQTKRKKRKDATCGDLVESIQSFYLDPKISRELPCMRTVHRQRQTFIMEVPVAQAFVMWKAENPEVSAVSLSVFQKLRPTFVLLQRSTTLNQCLCEYCTSIMLKLEALNRVLSVCEAKDLHIKNKYNLIDFTTCDKGSQRFHDLKCTERTCKDCGTSLLTEHFASFKDRHGERKVSWLAWESRTYTHDGKQKTKKVQVTKENTCAHLIEEITMEAGPLAKHVFIANWQSDMFSLIKRKLPLGWSLLVMDFAENYSCLSQDEIQAAHWAIQQVTVHPVVCFYHCQHDDGTSHIAQEALVFLSDDLRHDSHLVHHFEMMTLHHLKDRGVQLIHVVEFTDGCSAQYKSRSPFANISYSKHIHGVSIERNYFGSRHGKGPSDGVSGCVKSTVRRAVISRRAVVNNVENMYSFCEKNMTLDNCRKQRRTFFLVRQDDVQRNRPESEVKASLAGTRQLHAVRCHEPGVLDTRLLSCFCDGCLEKDERNSCSNAKYVIPWQRRALKMVNQVPTPPQGKDQPALLMTAGDVDMVDKVPGNGYEPEHMEQENIEEIWKQLQGLLCCSFTSLLSL